jgi:predicted nucleic acid-binding protein
MPRAAPAPPGMLGSTIPEGPVLLDTDVFINALTGRGPPLLRQMLLALPRFFIAAPTRAELAWLAGRLDPKHPGTARVLAETEAVQARIDPVMVLLPDDDAWRGAAPGNEPAVSRVISPAAATGSAPRSIVWS